MALKNTDRDAVLVVAAVIYRNGEVAIFRRGQAMSGAGHWEFPGGKVEKGETETQALEREISEELAVKIQVEAYLGENLFQYPHKKVHLRFYWVPAPQQDFVLSEHDAFQWVKPGDMDICQLSEADQPIVERIKLDSRIKT